VRRALILIAVVVAAGCGAGRGDVSTDGSGVLADVQDGRLDKSWSCGSLMAARARFSPTALRSAGVPSATAKACDHAILAVHRGMTEKEVIDSLGTPQVSGGSKLGKACWFFSWSPAPVSPIDGARICFKGGKVRLVQRSLHG